MKSRTINPDLLPILTDKADGTPVATTELVLSEQQSHQLAEHLFPQLETTIREAIASQSSWGSAMQQVRNGLPELIRKAAQKPL